MDEDQDMLGDREPTPDELEEIEEDGDFDDLLEDDEEE